MDDSTKAYIAGFLDGDGSIMLQLKPRIGVRYGYRIYEKKVLCDDRRTLPERKRTAFPVTTAANAKMTDPARESKSMTVIICRLLQAFGEDEDIV